MERHSPLTMEQILNRLASVIGHKQTGTFYIATDHNTSCRFAVNDGKLTHCTHRRDQGQAALLSLLETGGGSCSFSENQSIPFRAEAAIEHQVSLRLLGITPLVPPKPVVNAPPARIPPEKSEPVVKMNNQFYRGSAPTTQAASDETPVHKAEPPPAPVVNNRFYRGGG